MAEVLDDGEFWLPRQFLTDDDLFMDQSKVKNSLKNLKDGFGLVLDESKSLFSYEFPFGFNSDLSSPVESVVGSTETESDEEDYLVGLTSQMARSTLEEDFGRNDRAFSSENTKGWVLSISPESTLSAFRRGYKHGSSHATSNCQSRVSSSMGTWVLLHAAAEQVERLRLNEESYVGFNNGGPLGPPAGKPSPNLDLSGFYPNQSLCNQNLRATQQVLQKQLMKQHNTSVWGGQKQQHQHVVLQNRAKNCNNRRPPGLSLSAWPPLQQQQQQQQSQPQSGSGMCAVYLGNPTGKRECAGTGVFLPRRTGTAESRKKQACSTVLLPDKVIQALKLNLDESSAQPQRRLGFNASLTADSDAGLRLRSGGNYFSNQKQRKFRPQQGISHEVRLPQEWTY